MKKEVKSSGGWFGGWFGSGGAKTDSDKPGRLC